MTKFWNTYRFLVVFLFSSFLMSAIQLHAQSQGQVGSNNNWYMANPAGSKIDVNALLQNNENGQNNANQTNEVSVNDDFEGNYQQRNQEFYELTTSYGAVEDYLSAQNGYSIGENENLIKLHMGGNSNSIMAIQKQGSGNIMDVKYYGNSNQGYYRQQGSDNFIYDQIGTLLNHETGVYREIIQNGTGLGVVNTGIPKMDMIINQNGAHMLLKINSSPPF